MPHAKDDRLPESREGSTMAAQFEVAAADEHHGIEHVHWTAAPSSALTPLAC